MEADKKTNKKIVQGVVVSDKMEKTIVISVSTRKLHSLYKKYLTRSRKIKVHDEKNDAKAGDTVRAIETRPLSKDKHWRLIEIVERAK